MREHYRLKDDSHPTFETEKQVSEAFISTKYSRCVSSDSINLLNNEVKLHVYSLLHSLAVYLRSGNWLAVFKGNVGRIQ